MQVPSVVRLIVATTCFVPLFFTTTGAFHVDLVQHTTNYADQSENLTVPSVLTKLKDEAGKAPLFSATNAEVLPNRYIVVFKTQATPEQIENHHNLLVAWLSVGVAQDSVDKKIAAHIKHIYEMDGFKGYAGSFDETMLENIRSRPEVAYIETDQVVKATNLQTNAPWGLARISHRETLNFRTYNKYPYHSRAGDGVNVYVIDTGVYIDHDEFEGRATWGYTVLQDGDTNEDEDKNGHGTHCAGTIAGKTYGVAKNAHIIAVKVLGSNGSGTMAGVIEGVDWVAKHAQTTKTKSVANMSLGGGLSKALNAAVDAAVDAGIYLSVAAGNSNDDACGYSPAGAKNVISVGATNINDTRAWFSNVGKCVHVFAPGLGILSTWIGGKKATNTISGTSMASPHVAGLYAYILSRYDYFTPATLRDYVMNTSTKNILTDVKDTNNLLIYSNPPSCDDESGNSLCLGEEEEMTLIDLLEKLIGIN